MIRKVKINQIVCNTEYARRFIMTPDADLLVDMNRNGQGRPVMVFEIPRTGWFWFFKSRRYELNDGYRRFGAAKYLKWTHLLVLIVPVKYEPASV